tara:strand:- start:1599 stop:2345 length:747 start_codon:yes stop_codon:yes gene_type:complete
LFSPETPIDTLHRVSRKRLDLHRNKNNRWAPEQNNLPPEAMVLALLITSIGMTVSTSNTQCGRRAVVRQAAASAVTFCALPALANTDAGVTAVSTQTPRPDGVGADFDVLPSGVRIKDVRPGSGPQAKLGDVVSVQLSGRCLNLNGKKFISTQDPATLATGLQLSEPFVFTLGSGTVVPGLDQAVLGMAKGGYRRSVVPASRGYDVAMSLQPQPQSFQDLRSLESIVKNPNRDASLLFDVQLERIRPK